MIVLTGVQYSTLFPGLPPGSLKVVEMHTWSSDWKRVIIIMQGGCEYIFEPPLGLFRGYKIITINLSPGLALASMVISMMMIMLLLLKTLMAG
jgi:hypothetical protein